MNESSEVWSLPSDLPQPIDQNPEGYIASPELRYAVEAALLTGMPLLVTGEPGSGKTQLAYAVAHRLGLPEPLRFDTKSTSTAKDLLYSFDIVGRFYDAETRKLNLETTGGRDPGKPGEYVSFAALGAAFWLASERRPTLLATYARALAGFPDRIRSLATKSEPVRTIVLIDEVDKAPRDFPNDLLNELENLRFHVAETNHDIAASPAAPPILILTSNAERDLPEPFLRRCAYFHIESVPVEQIVASRLGAQTALTRAALEHFRALREEVGFEKLPSVAELLIWLRLLERHDFQAIDFQDSGERVRQTYLTLFKTQADRTRARLWRGRG